MSKGLSTKVQAWFIHLEIQNGTADMFSPSNCKINKNTDSELNVFAIGEELLKALTLE